MIRCGLRPLRLGAYGSKARRLSTAILIHRAEALCFYPALLRKAILCLKDRDMGVRDCMRVNRQTIYNLLTAWF